MKAMPMIQKVMTPMPHTIGYDLPIDKALTMMREYRIRHLPVQSGGKLVGIITDRDLKLAASFDGADKCRVEDVMTQDPYVVSEEATVDQVAEEMAEHKMGCVIVVQSNGKVVGIFTATDGMKFLTRELQEHYRPRTA